MAPCGHAHVKEVSHGNFGGGLCLPTSFPYIAPRFWERAQDLRRLKATGSLSLLPHLPLARLQYLRQLSSPRESEYSVLVLDRERRSRFATGGVSAGWDRVITELN